INAINAISDDKFGKIINSESSSIVQRVHELFDDVIFFLNQHFQINEEQGSQLYRLINQIKRIFLDLMRNNQIMVNKISQLEDNIQVLKK
ncbi:unnamed protein product, partial [Rotaria sp. Silwood1]